MVKNAFFATTLALLVTGCSQRGCARTPQAAAIDRFTREPTPVAHVTSERLVFHDVRLDQADAILPWADVEAPFHHVAELGFHAFVSMKPAPNGSPPYFSAAMFEVHDDDPFAPGGWLQNPPGLAAMLVRASLRFRAYSGDDAPLARARSFVDHVLSHGLTQEGDAWSLVPYSSANGGELEYRGGDDTVYCKEHDACGRGDGRGFLEPDKIGELGHALVLLFEATGDARYLEAALRCADALAKHVAAGDATHSPWPFRVDAKTGTVVREPYGSNVIFAIALFEELAKLGKSSPSHANARELAWSWLMQHPMRSGHWQGYFEDIPIHEKPGTNPNQYSAGETARYLLLHPERDPDWRAHVESILQWIVRTFAVDTEADGKPTPGHWHGAEVISEQGEDMAKMGSHTARFASLLAMLHEKTGDPALRARAFRSLSWATYCIDERGVVKVGPDDREGYWFSDGYGDYLPHFLDAIAAVPAWAPSGQDHLLRSSSVVSDITYAPARIAYRTFDAHAVDELRLRKRPSHVKAGGKDADAKITDVPGGGVHVVVTHDTNDVTIEL